MRNGRRRGTARSREARSPPLSSQDVSPPRCGLRGRHHTPRRRPAAGCSRAPIFGRGVCSCRRLRTLTLLTVVTVAARPVRCRPVWSGVGTHPAPPASTCPARAKGTGRQRPFQQQQCRTLAGGPRRWLLPSTCPPNQRRKGGDRSLGAPEDVPEAAGAHPRWSSRNTTGRGEEAAVACSRRAAWAAQGHKHLPCPSAHGPRRDGHWNSLVGAPGRPDRLYVARPVRHLLGTTSSVAPDALLPRIASTTAKSSATASLASLRPPPTTADLWPRSRPSNPPARNATTLPPWPAPLWPRLILVHGRPLRPRFLPWSSTTSLGETQPSRRRHGSWKPRRPATAATRTLPRRRRRATVAPPRFPTGASPRTSPRRQRRCWVARPAPAACGGGGRRSNPPGGGRRSSPPGGGCRPRARPRRPSRRRWQSRRRSHRLAPRLWPPWPWRGALRLRMGGLARARLWERRPTYRHLCRARHRWARRLTLSWTTSRRAGGWLSRRRLRHWCGRRRTMTAWMAASTFKLAGGEVVRLRPVCCGECKCHGWERTVSTFAQPFGAPRDQRGKKKKFC